MKKVTFEITCPCKQKLILDIEAGNNCSPNTMRCSCGLETKISVCFPIGQEVTLLSETLDLSKTMGSFRNAVKGLALKVLDEKGQGVFNGITDLQQGEIE